MPLHGKNTHLGIKRGYQSFFYRSSDHALYIVCILLTSSAGVASVSEYDATFQDSSGDALVFREVRRRNGDGDDIWCYSGEGDNRYNCGSLGDSQNPSCCMCEKGKYIKNDREVVSWKSCRSCGHGMSTVMSDNTIYFIKAHVSHEDGSSFDVEWDEGLSGWRTYIYADTTAQRAKVCGLCGAGSYKNGEVCVRCAAGSYQDAQGMGYCLLCPQGTYSGAGQSLCTDCPSGKTTLSQGRSALSECVTCDTGQFAADGMCQSCGAGQEASTGANACGDCQGGTYATASDVSCQQCKAGKYSASNAEKCEACPSGKNSIQGQATTESDCYNCQAGFFVGTDSVDLEAKACVECPAGYYSVPGSEFCNAQCPDGTGALGTFRGCQDCPPGKYADHEVQGETRMLCRDCAQGKYSTTMRATSESTCLTCQSTQIVELEGIVQYSPPGSDSATKCLSCNSMIGEYADFDASACKQCSWPFGLHEVGENMVCGPCPSGNLPILTTCAEPVDGRFRTDLLNACHTGHCRATPGYLQSWHFKVALAGEKIYHTISYNLPALFQRASLTVDLGRNYPPELGPNEVFEDDGAQTLQNTYVDYVDLLACQPGFYCTENSYVWVLNYTLQRMVGEAREFSRMVEYHVVFSPVHDPDMFDASKSQSMNNALIYSSWPFPNPGQNIGQRCEPGYTTLTTLATEHDCVRLPLHVESVDYNPTGWEEAHSNLLREDYFPYVSAVYDAWTTAPFDVVGLVAATYSCAVGFEVVGSANLSPTAGCAACASYDPPRYNDGGGTCEVCVQDCASSVAASWQTRVNAFRAPGRQVTVAWSTSPENLDPTSLTKLDTCGGATAGTCMCPQGFYLTLELPALDSQTPYAWTLQCAACPPGSYQAGVGIPSPHDFFTRITSGTCSQHGLQIITNFEACQKASRIYDVQEDFYWQVTHHTEVPLGCSWLVWNEQTFLHLSSDLDSTIECSEEIPCLCQQTVCLSCLPGQESAPGNNGCRDCPVDTYNPVNGQMCQTCWSFQGVTNVKFESGNATAVGGTECVPCPAGYFFDVNEHMCEACTEGKFRTLDSNSLTSCDFCEWCPLGDEYRSGCDAATGEITCVACECSIYEYCYQDPDTKVVACYPCFGYCGAGQEYYGCGVNANGLCRACDAGKYKEGFGMHLCSDCVQCGGTEQVVTECGGTSAGSCGRCEIGEYASLATDTCEECPACGIGEHDPCCSWNGETWFCGDDGHGPHATCTACHELARPQPSSQGCQPCPDGFYNDEVGVGCLSCENLWSGRSDSECYSFEKHICPQPAPPKSACQPCPYNTVLDLCENVCREIPQDSKLGPWIHCDNAEHENRTECTCVEPDSFEQRVREVRQCGVHSLSRTNVSGCVNLMITQNRNGWDYQTAWYDKWIALHCTELDVLENLVHLNEYCTSDSFTDYLGTYSAKQACCVCGGGEIGEKLLFPFEDCRCEDGYFWDAAQLACSECKQNEFFSNVYTADGALDHYQPFETCTPCPTGSGHFLTAQTNIEACVCQAGFEPISDDAVSLSQSPRCELCPPGTSKSHASTVRHHQSNGTLLANWPATDFCVSCPPGTFSEYPGQEQCLECPPGFYCGARTSVPENCPGEMISQAGSSQVQHCECTATGTFLAYVDESTQVCKTCSECRAGFFDPCCSWNVSKNDWHCAEGSDDLFCKDVCFHNVFQSGCIPCPSGFFKNRSGIQTCEPCPVCALDDHVCLATRTGACLDCAPGTYARPDASQCETCRACTAGKYDPCCSWDLSEQQRFCVQNPEAVNCVDVDAGTAGDWYCSVHHDDPDCVEVCQQEVFELECKNCPSGTYKDTHGSMACEPCPACLAMQRMDPVCGGVDPGECVDCAQGKYSQPGDLACHTCPTCSAGTYDPCCSWDSAADTWNCVAHSTDAICNQTCGDHIGPTECINCAVGTYKATAGSANCAPCPACSAMQVQNPPCHSTHPGSCIDCPAAKYSRAGDDECQDCDSCPSGEYDPCCSWNSLTDAWTCPDQGDANCNFCVETAPSLQCTACPSGTYKPTEGSGGCLPCDTCPASTSITQQCGGVQNVACKACASGMYSGENANHCQLCTSCDEGFHDPTCAYNFELDDSFCSLFPSHVDCISFQVATPSECKACPDGFYKDSAANQRSACQECTERRTTGRVDSLRCPDLTRVTDCGGDTGGTCKACPAGHFFDACDNTCTPLPDYHRRIEVSCADSPTHPRCAACGLQGRSVKTHDTVECGPQSLPWSEGISEETCNCESGFSFQLHTTTSNAVSLRSTGSCVQCSEHQYYDACAEDVAEKCKPLPAGMRRTDVNCADETSHPSCACDAALTQAYVSCGIFGVAVPPGASGAECHCAPGYARAGSAENQTCVACGPGTYGLDSQCVACPEHEGHAQSAQVDITSCVCDPGFVPRLRTCAGVRVFADREDVKCLSCPPGKFKAGRSGVQHRKLAGKRVDEAAWEATEVCELCAENSFA